MQRPRPEPNQPGTDAVSHFQQMAKLAQALECLGIAVRGHEYDPHFFGMWSVVAGSFDHRFKFDWDDRDQVLTISEADFEQFGNLKGDWRKIGEQVIDKRGGADLFAYVETFLRRKCTA